jgi:hypothetical protein
MFGVFLSLLTIITLGLTAIFLMLKMMQNYKPGRSKIQKDLQEIKAELKPWIVDLIPWSREEMEQLSLNQINKSSKKRIINTSKGIFTTIYHEPVIAYCYRSYFGKGENALLYARTSDSEFIYRIKDGQTELVIDNELVGTLNSNGVLYHYKTEKPIAQLKQTNSQQLHPIDVGEREVGSLVNPARANKFNSRAFELLVDMKKEEEKVFLSLAILQMVRK